MTINEQIKRHARENAPNECCGILKIKNGQFVLEKKESNQKHLFFIKEVSEDASFIYHSHVFSSSLPSQSDINNSNYFNIPYYIYSVKDDSFYLYNRGKLPLIDRPYCNNIADCLSLAQDFYAEKGINILDVFIDRSKEEWWLKENLFLENIKFSRLRVIQDRKLKENDLILMSVNSKFPNHCAVYIGGGKILHQVRNQPSCIEPLSGIWLKSVKYVCRLRDD